jgi:hypothetical protein
MTTDQAIMTAILTALALAVYNITAPPLSHAGRAIEQELIPPQMVDIEVEETE